MRDVDWKRQRIQMKIHNPKKKWATMTERERRASLARTWDDLASFYEKMEEAWRPFREWLCDRMENIAKHYGVELSNGPINIDVSHCVRLYRGYGKKPKLLPRGVIKDFDRLANCLFAQGFFPRRRIDRILNCIVWELGSPLLTYDPKTGKSECIPSNPWKEKKEAK